MLKSFEETLELVKSGKWLHIAGSADLLKKLPIGNWIAGSVEYFMDQVGGIVTDQQLFVDEIQYSPCKIMEYDAKTIENLTGDTYENGFSIIIMPFGSDVRNTFSLNSPEYKDIFLKSIVGWVSGTNLSKPEQVPLVFNGQTGNAYTDKAVVLHVSLPDDRIANIGIINIFSPDENSPVIEFLSNSAIVEKCLIDGKETVLVDYLAENNINTKVPLLGEYFGANLNMSIFAIENGAVTFAAPCFTGVKYRFGKNVPDYPKAFMEALQQFKDTESVFACNCAYNFMYGELEGKKMDCFYGPMSFGEIAYQLLNQTLVYLIVS